MTPQDVAAVAEAAPSLDPEDEKLLQEIVKYEIFIDFLQSTMFYNLIMIFFLENLSKRKLRKMKPRRVFNTQHLLEKKRLYWKIKKPN